MSGKGLSRRGLRTAGAVATALGLSASLVAPVHATVRPQTNYIVFVAYFVDANHTNLVGSRTFDDCPGEQGTYGWGAQTSYYTIDSEPC